MPDENFDYDKFVEENLTADKPIKPRVAPVWAILALILAGLLLFGWLR